MEWQYMSAADPNPSAKGSQAKFLSMRQPIAQCTLARKSPPALVNCGGVVLCSMPLRKAVIDRRAPKRLAAGFATH
jgi:hypothetical protein